MIFLHPCPTLQAIISATSKSTDSFIRNHLRCITFKLQYLCYDMHWTRATSSRFEITKNQTGYNIYFLIQYRLNNTVFDNAEIMMETKGSNSIGWICVPAWDPELVSLRDRPLMIWGGRRKIENEFIFSPRKPFECFFSWRRPFFSEEGPFKFFSRFPLGPLPDH